MKAENEVEAETSKVDPFDLLSGRFSADVLLSSLIRQLKEGHERAGAPVRRAFSGEDPTEPVALLLAEALVCNQVTLLELRTANHVRTNVSGYMKLAESKARELEMLLVQAARLALDIHMNVNGIG